MKAEVTRDPGRARARAGFSLIEILVVIAIISLLATLGVRAALNAREQGTVVKCRDNLHQMAQMMLVFHDTRNKGHWPQESGIRFLLTLHKVKELSGRNAETFLCPGTEDTNDGGPSGEPGSSYEDWANIDSGTISYAGRDQQGSPIKGSDLSAIVIAADDNEGRANHKHVTNYAYADGSTDSFDISNSVQGTELLSENPELEKTGLPVGPDSPLELLRVLRVD
ncbi:MAG TPA: prepilin-type N-terminal cleavage/methylation domain-containing protein [Planctomycetota bacterium]|nr:prepilin-type N-terminal cleavage/methylation domain-containing protein [Planctomycetota bacterium]